MNKSRTNFLRLYPTRYGLPVLLILDFGFVYSRNAQWAGNWLWTADWDAGSLLIIGPLAAGLAAWHMAFQRAVFEPALQVRNSRRLNFLVLRQQIYGSCGMHLIVVTTTVVQTAALNHDFDRNFVHVIAQFVILSGYIAAGVVLGRLLNGYLVAPLAFFVAFSLPILRVAGIPSALFKYGGATGNLSGLAPFWPIDIAQSVFGVGLVTLALFLTIPVRRPMLSSVYLPAVGVAVCAVSLTYLAVQTHNRFSLYQEKEHCDTDIVTLCLLAGSVYARAKVRSVLTATYDAEVGWGVGNFPNRVVQVGADGSLPSNLSAGSRAIFLDSSSLKGSNSVVARAILPGLIIDARCLDPAVVAPAAIPALNLAADMILLEIDSTSDVAKALEVRRFRAHDPAAQVGWLKAMLTATNACRLDHPPAMLT